MNADVLIVLTSLSVSFVSSFITTFVLVPVLRHLAIKKNILDIPDGHIKNHKIATPYLGGIAIFIGILASFIIYGVISGLFYDILNTQTILLFIGLAFLLILGLVDDLFVLFPFQKIMGQALAAICFLLAGFCFNLPLFSPFLNFLISFWWILSIVNAFNLIDVMDGLATVTGLFAALACMFFAYEFQNLLIFVLTSALAGGLTAFFWYNKPPAKIYLGDAGALFIGGLLACFSLSLPWDLHHRYYGFLVPIIILAVPLLEMGTLIVIRTYKGIAFYRGSPDHFSCYLRNKGWGINKVLMFVASVSCVLFMLSYIVAFSIFSIFKTSLLCLLGVIIWLFLIFKTKRNSLISN